MLYARSILKNKWKSDAPMSISSVEDIHTQQGLLSVWQYDAQHKLDVALAIAMTRSYINEVVLVVFNESDLRKALKGIQHEEGESKWKEYNNHHDNLVFVEFSNVQWILNDMWKSVLSKDIVICTKNDLKKHFYECVQNQTISQATVDYILAHKEEANFKRWDTYIQEALKKS